MDSIFLHQKANDLVQSVGTRSIRLIAENVGMRVDEIDHFKELK